MDNGKNYLKILAHLPSSYHTWSIHYMVVGSEEKQKKKKNRTHETEAKSGNHLHCPKPKREGLF